MYSARNKIQPFRLKGFTILELIIVIVITSLVFSVGVAGFRGFQRRSNLEGAVIRVKSHLRLAQQMALSGVRHADCITLGYSMESIVFQIDSSTTYSIREICTDGTSTITSSPINSYILLPDYSGVGVSGGPVVFKVLGGGVENLTTITLTQSGVSTVINITEGGEIYE